MATELKLKTFKYSKIVAVDDQPGEWQADICPHIGLLKGLQPCQSQPATPQAPALWHPGYNQYMGLQLPL